MELHDFIEAHEIKDIALKTNISEENLRLLLNKEFDAITKVKALGFISIIEREYKIDLSSFRKEAKRYYDEHGEDVGVVLEPLSPDRKGGGWRWWLLVLAVIVAGAVWYIGYAKGSVSLEKWQEILPFSASQSSVELETQEENQTEASDEVLTQTL